MLNKDSFILGITMGIIIPAIGFGIIYLLNLMIEQMFLRDELLKTGSLQILSIALNALVIRYYLVKMKYDHTGRGVLLITFIYFFLFFLLNHKW